MILKVCLVLACCLATLVAASDDDMATFSAFGTPFNAGLVMTVRQQLNARLDAIWVNHPASTVCGGCLIDHWFTNYGTAVGRTFHVTQIDAALAGMPADLVNKVRSIVFASKVEFEMFRHSIAAPTASGHYLQYLGIARRTGDSVDLAVLKGEVVGRLVKKYYVHYWRTCGRILWWECCCQNHQRVIERGYQAPEILQIETAMRAETVRRLRERASDISF